MIENHDTMKSGYVTVILFGTVLLAASNQTAHAAGEKELFVKNCASCHGLDGKAQTLAGRKLGVKDLSKSQLNEAQIEQQILEGRAAGQNTSRMPAFKGRLTAEEIRALVPVVKAFRE